MTDLHTTQDENFSALMDGELHGAELHSAVRALLSESEGRGTWHAYHVVGDVLRSEELSGAGQDLQFWAKLETRLALEPLPSTLTSASSEPSGRYLQSSNAPIFWRVLAGGACSVLVAVIGISVWSPSVTAPPISMAGVAPAAFTSSSAQSSPLNVAVDTDGMMRDPRLDQLLSAHQQLGGHSALQMPSGFLRNATYEGGGR